MLLVKHLHDKEIADVLGIGPGTVHTHLVRLRDKCGGLWRMELGECAVQRAEAWKGAAKVAEVRAAVLARAREKRYLRPEPQPELPGGAARELSRVTAGG